MIRVLRHLPTADVVSLHGSTYGFILQSTLIKPLCSLFRKPLMGRLFGGSFKNLYEQSGALTRWLIRNSFALDMLLIESKQVASYFHGILPQTRIEWFPNSRHMRCGTTPSKVLASPLKLIFAGHIKNEKGIGIALNAIGIARSEVRCDFYGRPKDNDLIPRINETPGCSYRGAVPSEELLLRMREYDVLLMPTFYEGEGYPGVILEAFSLGLPVIASNWKFIPEIVEDGVNGLLVEPRDPEALAAAIDRIASDPAAYEIMSRNAFSTAREFDTKKWNGDRFEELVNDLAHR